MKRTLGFLTLLAALACLPAFAESGVTAKVKGTFRDNRYTAPDKTFSVEMPALVRPGIVIEDEVTADGQVGVRFKDNFCRRYHVSRFPMVDPYLDQAQVERYARVIAAGWSNTKQAVLHSIDPVDIGRGPAVVVAQQEPQGPCTLTTFRGSEKQTKLVPAEALAYVFLANGGLYEVRVVKTEMGEDVATFHGTDKPLNEMLDTFLAGLETRSGSQKLQKSGLPASQSEDATYPDEAASPTTSAPVAAAPPTRKAWEASKGGCHLSVTEVVAGRVFRVRVEGLEPGESFQFLSQSDGEIIRGNNTADDDGYFSTHYAPAVIGKTSGSATIIIKGSRCRVTITIPWRDERVLSFPSSP